MRFFKGDLFRCFVFGFALGALGLVLTMGDGTDSEAGLVSHAVAAPLSLR